MSLIFIRVENRASLSEIEIACIQGMMDMARFTPDTIRFTTCDPRGHIDFYVDARAHIDVMFNFLADGLLDIHKRFGYLIPDSDGDYLLSFADDSPVFIEVDAGPIQSVLTYK